MNGRRNHRDYALPADIGQYSVGSETDCEDHDQLGDREELKQGVSDVKLMSSKKHHNSKCGLQ